MKKSILTLILLGIFFQSHSQDRRAYVGLTGFQQLSITTMSGDVFDGPLHNVWTPVFGKGLFIGARLNQNISLELGFNSSELVNTYSLFKNNALPPLEDEDRFTDLRWSSNEISLELSMALVRKWGFTFGTSLGAMYVSRNELLSDTNEFKLQQESFASTEQVLTYFVEGPYMKQVDGASISSGLWLSKSLGSTFQIGLDFKWVSGIRPVASTTMHATWQDPSSGARWLEHDASTNNSGFRASIKLIVLFPEPLMN